MEPGKWVRNVLDQKTGCLSFALYSCMHDAFPGEKVYIQGSWTKVQLHLFYFVRILVVLLHGCLSFVLFLVAVMFSFVNAPCGLRSVSHKPTFFLAECRKRWLNLGWFWCAVFCFVCFSGLCLASVLVLSVILICLLSRIFQHIPTWMALYGLIVLMCHWEPTHSLTLLNHFHLLKTIKKPTYSHPTESPNDTRPVVYLYYI